MLVFLTISLFFIAACQQQAPPAFPDEPVPPGEQQQNLAGEAFAYGAVIPELYGLPYDTYGLYAENRQVLVSRAPGAAPGQEAFFFMVNEPYQTFPAGNTINLKATATMPGGLVFNKGYIYKRDVDGTIQWVPFDYIPDDTRGGRVRQFVNEEGTLQNSNWISGAAKAEVGLAVADLTIGENYVVAYTCLKASPIDPWKCGCNEAREPECRRWSLQKFMVCEDGEMVNSNGICVTVPECPVQQEMTVTPVQITAIETIFDNAGIDALEVEEQCEPDAADPLYVQCTDGQETAVFFKCAIEEFPAQAEAVKTELGPALPPGLIEEPPVTSACAEAFMNDGAAAPTTQSECIPKDGDATAAVRGTCDGTTAVSYGCVDGNDACTREVRYDCATGGQTCRDGVCVNGCTGDFCALITAAGTCSASSLSPYVYTVDVGALMAAPVNTYLQTTDSTIEIRGPNGDGKCQLYTRTNTITFEAGSAVTDPTSIQTELTGLNLGGNIVEGKDQTCLFPDTTVLVNLLTRWNVGDMSSTDFDGIECSGSLVDLASGAGGSGSGSSTDMTLTSSAFSEGDTLPESAGDNDAARCPVHYASAENKNPPLSIGNVPAGTVSLVLVVTDETTGFEGLPHWVVWGIPAATTVIDAGIDLAASIPTARQGNMMNDGSGYLGPCPPANGGEHTYQFILFALSEQPDHVLSTTKTVEQTIQEKIQTGDLTGLETELASIILGSATLSGTYTIT